jgi:hypothetical protein
VQVTAGGRVERSEVHNGNWPSAAAILTAATTKMAHAEHMRPGVHRFRVRLRSCVVPCPCGTEPRLTQRASTHRRGLTVPHLNAKRGGRTCRIRGSRVRLCSLSIPAGAVSASWPQWQRRRPINAQQPRGATGRRRRRRDSTPSDARATLGRNCPFSTSHPLVWASPAVPPFVTVNSRFVRGALASLCFCSLWGRQLLAPLSASIQHDTFPRA